MDGPTKPTREPMKPRDRSFWPMDRSMRLMDPAIGLTGISVRAKHWSVSLKGMGNQLKDRAFKLIVLSLRVMTCPLSLSDQRVGLTARRASLMNEAFSHVPWWNADYDTRASLMAFSGQASTHLPHARQASARGV
jgi:hypothetical protein